MDYQNVVFSASPFMYFIGFVHQLTGVKKDLLIYFSSTFAFAAPKTRSTSNINLIFTDTFNSRRKNFFFFFFLLGKKAFRIQNCSLGNTIFGNKIGYKHLKGKFRHFPRCSLRSLKRFTLYKMYPFACIKNHFPESAT